MDTYNEKELLMLIADGDEAAFTSLFVSYARILHPFISGILKSEDMSEEVIQQIFLKLWLKRDQLPDVEYPRAYIFQMASNECFAHMRKKSAERRHYAELEQSNASENTTDSQVTIWEIEALVQEAFRQLPPQQQRIYLLSRKQHLRIPEIAGQLGLSPLTVKNSLVKSLKSIRLHLEKEGYWLPAVLIIGIL